MTIPRRRALLAVYDFPPMSGGIARAMGEIARHAESASLVVSTGRVAGSAAFDAACVSRIDRGAGDSNRLRSLFGLVRWSWRARALAAELRPEFVWAGNLKPAGHIARWLGANQRLPYGLIVHGLDLQRLAQQARSSRIKRRTARGLIGDAAGTVAISTWTRNRFQELACELGQPEAAERVRVVRLGVDADRFRPNLPVDGLRERYGLDQRPWLLTVARLIPHKGIDTGLAVVARLRREGLDVGYAVVGEGPALPALRQQADELGVTAAVRWLGWVPEPDLPALYAAASVYLGLSREEGLEVEGFGLSLLEASACGIPVVAGRGGGTSEAVAHGITGYLAADDQSAARAVRELLLDPSKAGALGAAGRSRVEREFTWSRVVRDLEEAAAGFRDGWAQRGGR